MNILKVAAFSDGASGGNPAGVVVGEVLPSPETMQDVARQVGFSETAFAAPEGKDGLWRVRYFSPETEVEFCGHATIALGAVLAEMKGTGRFRLKINSAEISVDGTADGNLYSATLQSPPTHSTALDEADVAATLRLFGVDRAQIDFDIPPARIHGGADHYVFCFEKRKHLAAMHYDLNEGRAFMRRRGLTTIMLVHRSSDHSFAVRNAFASGGVLEDAATGAAAAAFAGYLRDIDWRSQGRFDIVQGEDMGAKSLIHVEYGPAKGSSVRVSGTARKMF